MLSVFQQRFTTTANAGLKVRDMLGFKITMRTLELAVLMVLMTKEIPQLILVPEETEIETPKFRRLDMWSLF